MKWLNELFIYKVLIVLAIGNILWAGFIVIFPFGLQHGNGFMQYRGLAKPILYGISQGILINVAIIFLSWLRWCVAFILSGYVCIEFLWLINPPHIGSRWNWFFYGDMSFAASLQVIYKLLELTVALIGIVLVVRNYLIRMIRF